MDFRIIDTDTIPLLIYRDLNEDNHHELIFQVCLDGVIMKQRATFRTWSAEHVQQDIAELTIERANHIVQTMAALLEDPMSFLKEDDAG